MTNEHVFTRPLCETSPCCCKIRLQTAIQKKILNAGPSNNPSNSNNHPHKNNHGPHNNHPTASPIANLTREHECLPILSLKPDPAEQKYDYTTGKLAELIIEEKTSLFVCAIGVPPKHAVDRLHQAGIPVCTPRIY
jgi:NAD(P)H-dependent flavin oxidoreductase YrpB (nitropropane dioxygenase family)